MKAAGKPHEARIYPPSGEGPGAGHGFVQRGVALWFEDAMRFLERNCR
jgi:hypothetical protein